MAWARHGDAIARASRGWVARPVRRGGITDRGRDNQVLRTRRPIRVRLLPVLQLRGWPGQHNERRGDTWRLVGTAWRQVGRPVGRVPAGRPGESDTACGGSALRHTGCRKRESVRARVLRALGARGLARLYLNTCSRPSLLRRRLRVGALTAARHLVPRRRCEWSRDRELGRGAAGCWGGDRPATGCRPRVACESKCACLAIPATVPRLGSLLVDNCVGEGRREAAAARIAEHGHVLQAHIGALHGLSMDGASGKQNVRKTPRQFHEQAQV